MRELDADELLAVVKRLEALTAEFERLARRRVVFNRLRKKYRNILERQQLLAQAGIFKPAPRTPGLVGWWVRRGARG